MSIVKYDQCFQKILSISKQQLEDLKFGDYGWSSLPHLLLINEIEREFDIRFPFESISRFTSYKEGLNLLAEIGVKLYSE